MTFAEETMTFAEEIERFIGDEPIEGVRMLSGRRYNDCFPNGILTWEEARPHLDYEYDNGYGSQDCHSVHIWTPTRVIYVQEYDGATWLDTLPRNPE